ncbi:MAG: molybdopterin cofactor-binding domain-containing protein [Candidatus Competibacterales bacterium]
MAAPFVGRALERVEDLSLLRGEGRYFDDLPLPPGTLQVAFLRSPFAHARLEAIDATKARALPGVAAVIAGDQLRAHCKPFLSGVKVDAPQYPLAVGRVRYGGEPVAMVVAGDRYRAEDALEAVEVRYAPLPVVVDTLVAAADGPERLHPHTPSNVLHERRFCYGDPEGAFARAARVVETTVAYPRNSCTPVECLGVLAHYRAGEGVYEVTTNFQGPYTLHPVMARSLEVPGNRLRLVTPPDSGGSYGVKQAVFPYVVAVALAARLTGRPVKWLEDRLEHLTAATASTNRVTTLKAALDDAGRLSALDYDQLEDCGAYLKAPEPATLYRMHGNMTGAYAVAHLAIRNRVVVTNKTPTGLMRGFGGPQVYFPLERLMDIAARELGLDPLELRRRNLVPGEAMPYPTAAGALLDSGDYPRSLARAVDEGELEALKANREAKRRAGKLYGIGYSVAVEPSISNMGYITTLLSPGERAAAGPKNGALASATVAFDPTGSLSVVVASVPQGQGHRTVIGQVVADVLGVEPQDVAVATDHDTLKDPWSIASGNYSSRFAGAVAGAVHRAALKLRGRLVATAAAQLGVTPESVDLAGGRAFCRGEPKLGLPISRVAAAAHWSPLSVPAAAGLGLRETEHWTMPQLAEPDGEDRVNSSGTHGLIIDFCGVEVDRDTGAVAIDRYVTFHDAGRLLNPKLADGQIQGAFAHGLGAALLEELSYGPDGGFQAGTLAEYLPPTACEVPPLTILHHQTPSPFTPLGAKGLGEGNCMSTPVCIANAVADAIDCPVTTLPLTRSRVLALLEAEVEEPADPRPPRPQGPRLPLGDGHGVQGQGSTVVPAPAEVIWATLFDQVRLAGLIPGCRQLERVGECAWRADASLGVGPVKGRFMATVAMEDMVKPQSLTLRGGAEGPLGSSTGEGRLLLTPVAGGTQVEYQYAVLITGKVAAVGGRMLEGATRTVIDQFFRRLIGQQRPRPRRTPALLAWVKRVFAGVLP